MTDDKARALLAGLTYVEKLQLLDLLRAMKNAPCSEQRA